MFNLPWWARWTFDLALFAGPYWLLCNYPRLGFTPCAEIRRKRRRKDYGEVKLRDNQAFDVDTVKSFRADLNFKEQ